jgi:hypothetical protein
MKRNGKPSVPGIEVEVTLDLPRRPKPEEMKPESAPRMPRVTRLMALAVKWQGMVDAGELRDYADIARLGYVSRARVTQIMNLSNLAPDLQEQLLFPSGSLPPERRLRGMVAQVDWDAQRRMWRSFT